MEFTSKKMPTNFLEDSSLIKFFNWLSHFLQICIILVSKNTQKFTRWPQKFVISFLAYEYQNYAEFYAEIQSVEIIGK